MIARDLFARVDPAKGRLRSFLLGSFKHYMSEEWQQARRQKRGGNRTFVAIDQVQTEEWYHAAAAEGLSPDALFDRSWFNSLIEKALDELEREHGSRGKEQLFQRLQNFLAWEWTRICGVGAGVWQCFRRTLFGEPLFCE